MVSGAVTYADDGSATIDLVYEKDESTATTEAPSGAPQPDQPIVFATQVG